MFFPCRLQTDLLFGLLLIFFFSFFLFLLLFLFFLRLLFLLFLILDLLVLPLGRLEEALLHLLLLLLLWRRLRRPVDVDIGDAAGGEDAVSPRHTPRDECRRDFGGGQGQHAAPPLAFRAARCCNGLCGRGRGKRMQDRAVPVAHRAFFELLLGMFLHQFRHGQPPLAHLGGAGGAQRAASS